MKLPLTINQLQTELKAKKYSAVEIVDTYLSAIRKHDTTLNAFITITDEYAYKQAKNIDETIQNNPNAFDEFPLLGVVISVKDLYLTKGIRTTAASKVLEDYVPQYSATVVERLEKAGCILIGKTNCDAWAHGGSGENSDFGNTLNPWNLDYVPGGSSSGSAVSVAANFALASMGTDTGGSVRLPASFTGTVGFKPTYGRVSRYGVVSMASSLDTMGHFTHSVEDSEKLFAVTKGADHKDSTIADRKEITSQKKVLGIAKEYMEGLDDDVADVLNRSQQQLEKLGYSFKEVSLPHMKYAVADYYIIQPAEVSSNLNRYDGVRYGNDRTGFGSEAKRRIMLGTYVLSSGYYDAYYLKAMKVRTKIIKDFEKAFETVDALFTPVSPTPAFKIGEKAADPLKMYMTDVFTVSANLAGIPGISLPAGIGNNNLPIGIQLMGPQFGENILFDIGKKFQSVTDWHTRLPVI